jgi:hypothetical protein
MTTLEVSPKGVLDLYRSRDAVERGFRITKETIKIRPIWSRTEQHIKAHLFVCFIAYLLYSHLEIEAKKQIAGITSVKTLDKLKILARRAKRDIDTGEVEDILSGRVDEPHRSSSRFGKSSGSNLAEGVRRFRRGPQDKNGLVALRPSQFSQPKWRRSPLISLLNCKRWA